MKSIGILKTWLPLFLLVFSFGAVQSHTLLLDFGGTVTTRGAGPANDPLNYWNHVSSLVGHTDQGSIANLVSTTNVNTGFGFQMVRRFSNTNTSGTELNEALPTNATKDSMFGNLGTYEGLTNIMPEFYLSGLDPNKMYNFGIFASRMSSFDNREGLYTFSGSNSSSALYNPADNISQMAYVNGITPDANGRIHFTLTPGPNNTNSVKYMYLGVLQIQEVPEPSVMAFGCVALIGIMMRRKRRLPLP